MKNDNPLKVSEKTVKYDFIRSVIMARNVGGLCVNVGINIGGPV